jgi:hypothetical protein
MTPLDKLTAAGGKLRQIAESTRDPGTKVLLTEISATIRCNTAAIRNGLESEMAKPPAARRFGLLAGDESPMPAAQKPLSRRAGA